jgi:hypothetical protein
MSNPLAPSLLAGGLWLQSTLNRLRAVSHLSRSRLHDVDFLKWYHLDFSRRDLGSAESVYQIPRQDVSVFYFPNWLLDGSSVSIPSNFYIHPFSLMV